MLFDTISVVRWVIRLLRTLTIKKTSGKGNKSFWNIVRMLNLLNPNSRNPCQSAGIEQELPSQTSCNIAAVAASAVKLRTQTHGDQTTYESENNIRCVQ